MSKHKNKYSRKLAKTGLVALGATMFAGVGLLAGCETKLPGSDANWYSGTETPTAETVGDVGDFYYDTDDCIIYQKDSDGTWKVISCVKGDQGEQGIQGEVGAKWFSGEGSPADSQDEDVINARVGDFYMDTLTNKIYRKGESAWTNITTIEDGEDGADGLTWFTGTEITFEEEGEFEISGAKVGDLYLNTSTANVYKCTAENTWELLCNIKGAQGGQGNPGQQGNAGVDGATWFTGTEIEAAGEVEIADSKVGDLYLNTETYNVYKCTAENTWELLCNIKGAAGDDGSNGENGTNGKDGVDGTNGTSFRSDFGAPAEDLGIVGDTYLDLETKLIYKKSESGWILTSSMVSVTAVSTAEEFVDACKQGEGTYVKLNNDIDLNDLDLATIYSGETTSIIADVFNGIIDGNDHTLTIPNTINDVKGYGYVFANLNGLVKDLTINYNNIENKSIAFAYLSRKGIRFEGVTTTGSIKVSENNSATNFSPFIGFVGANTQFVNCTNETNVSGVNYGAAFIGGYILRGSKPVLNRDGTERTEDQYKSEGYVGGVVIEFNNCINEGTLKMSTASMLLGNASWMPLPENVIIKDCENNGNIIGITQAGLYCGMFHEGYDYADNVAGLEEMDELVKEVIKGTGTCDTITLEGLTLTSGSGEEAKNMYLAIPEGEYTYKLGFELLLYSENGSNMATATIELNESNRDSSTGKLTYLKHKFIGKQYLDTLGDGVVKTKIDEANVVIAGGLSAELYLIEAGDERYYYFDLTDDSKEGLYYIQPENGISPTSRYYYVYAYDAEGNIVGKSTIK